MSSSDLPKLWTEPTKIVFYKSWSPSQRIFFSERFNQFLRQKNDFESTNFEMFKEVVHNFGKSDEESGKMLIFTRCIHGFMSNLIKKSWTDSIWDAILMMMELNEVHWQLLSIENTVSQIRQPRDNFTGVWIILSSFRFEIWRN